jgi:hypothetical protein
MDAASVKRRWLFVVCKKRGVSCATELTNCACDRSILLCPKQMVWPRLHVYALDAAEMNSLDVSPLHIFASLTFGNDTIHDVNRFMLITLNELVITPPSHASIVSNIGHQWSGVSQSNRLPSATTNCSVREHRDACHILELRPQACDFNVLFLDFLGLVAQHDFELCVLVSQLFEFCG